MEEETMSDSTESIRRDLLRQINTDNDSRQELEARYGQVWNTEELARDFEVIGFAAPFVVVIRKGDGVKGSLAFKHAPRFYFSFVGDS
jgi:hypothetical protein